MIEFMRDTIKSHYKSAGKFTLVGIANTAIDFLVFFVLHELMGVFFVFAHMASFITASCNSFYFNATWTFNKLDKKNFIKQGLSFIAVALVGLVLSTVTIYLASFYIWIYLAKLLAVVVSFAWNYTASCLFVFND